MKILYTTFSVLLVSCILFISCAPRVPQKSKAELAEETVKESLRDMLKEDEANRKKYNVKCNYTKRPGVATVTKIVEKGNAAQEMLVLYNFKPNVPAANESDYKQGNKDRTLLINGKLPSKQWCERNGIKLNARISANRMEIIEGYMTKYCEPLRFDFPQFKK